MRRFAKGIGFGLLLLTLIILVGRIYHQYQTRINTPAGIQESVTVTIGDTSQVLQLRGQNRNNPVILWLHGGPGLANPWLTYQYQPALEDDYTICYWVQRGAGRTYYASGEQAPNMTATQIESDITQIIDYLRERFGQDKVIIMGHSWGTQIGADYVLKHPEHIAAYIGVSQINDTIAAKALILDQAEALAQAAGNTTDVEGFRQARRGINESLKTRHLSADQYLTIERQASKYLPNAGVLSMIQNIWSFLTSPDLRWEDIKWYALLISDFARYTEIQGPLMQASSHYIRQDSDHFEVPVYFISGSLDWTAPYQPIDHYEQQITAPAKAFTLMKGAGHSPYLDHNDAFTHHVKQWLEAVIQ